MCVVEMYADRLEIPLEVAPFRSPLPLPLKVVPSRPTLPPPPHLDVLNRKRKLETKEEK